MIKTFFAVVVLSLVPAISFAACSQGHQVMSCATGSVWDADAGKCVDRANS